MMFNFKTPLWQKFNKGNALCNGLLHIKLFYSEWQNLYIKCDDFFSMKICHDKENFVKNEFNTFIWIFFERERKRKKQETSISYYSDSPFNLLAVQVKQVKS